MARFILLGGLRKSLPLRFVALSCVVSSFSVMAAYGADGLSREDILRQHQQLERQHDDPASVDDSQGTGMAPPLAPSSSGLDAPAPQDAPYESPASARRGKGDAESADNSSESLTARLLQRVNNLESQMRDMRGELDQLTNQVQQGQADMDKKLGDMQFAQQNRGTTRSNSDVTSRASSSVAAAGGDESPKPSLTPVKSGQEAIRARHYEDAEYYARAALKSAKSKSVKAEANFLLAQSMAGQKDYRQSAVSYFDAYHADPSSARAPEALLGVAASMLSLQNKSAACEALNKLNDEFPDASARVKSSAKVFRARASCH